MADENLDMIGLHNPVGRLLLLHDLMTDTHNNTDDDLFAAVPSRLMPCPFRPSRSHDDSDGSPPACFHFDAMAMTPVMLWACLSSAGKM